VLFTDKLEIHYQDYTATINFSSPVANINLLLPQCRDGFILMLIAGFMGKITPLNWTGWKLHNKDASCKFSIKDTTYSNTSTYDFKNPNGYVWGVNGLDNAIKFLNTQFDLITKFQFNNRN
jgi:hypothetical protein